MLAGDARRQHVIHGSLLAVLFYIHRTGLQRSVAARTQGMIVGAPLSPHQVKRTEAQHNGLLETREEHPHETDTIEVGNISHLRLKLIYGNTELIPSDGLVVGTIAQSWGILSLVHDEIAPHHHVLWSDADTILVIPLILIEGIVLVDVLHVWSGLIGSVVALRP